MSDLKFKSQYEIFCNWKLLGRWYGLINHQQKYHFGASKLSIMTTEDGWAMVHKVFSKRQKCFYTQHKLQKGSGLTTRINMVQYSSSVSHQSNQPIIKTDKNLKENGVLLQWTGWRAQQPTSYHSHLRFSLTTNSYWSIYSS